MTGPTVAYRLLGPLEVIVNDAEPPAELLWKKNVALLVYLACSREHRRTREHLIGLLWADKSDSAARQSLRESLRLIRRHLGADAVRTDRDDVALHLPMTLDTSRFEEYEEQNPAEAMELVRGEFLEGFAVPNAPEFETWLGSQRMEWKQRVLRASVRLIKNKLQSGDPFRASILATRAMRLEPGSDELVRLAMSSMALAGDRSSALDAYSDFVAHMDEAGVKPEIETERLASRIQNEREWSVASRSGDPRGVRRPRLVARGSELSASLRLWKRCRSEGIPVVITTDSEPGMGKTRLAEEVAGHARLDGALTFAVRGIAADQDHSFIGLFSLLDGGLLTAPGLASADPGALSALSLHLPAWAARFPSRANPSSDYPLDRAVREVLRSVLFEQPIFLLLDDAHFLDSESLQAIPMLVRDLTDASLLIWLNTATVERRNEIDELRSRIGRDVAGVNHRLAAFTAADIGELVHGVMEHLPTDQRERLARRVAIDSGGIPLLAVELLYAVESGMELDTIPADWPQPRHTLTQTMPGALPKSTVFAIRVGFRVLSEPAQRVMRVAAVINEPATVTMLEAGSGLAGDGLAEALDELEWQRWLAADSRGYTFVARIVRDVILEDMITRGQRQRILERVGEDPVPKPHAGS